MCFPQRDVYVMSCLLQTLSGHHPSYGHLPVLPGRDWTVETVIKTETCMKNSPEAKLKDDEYKLGN